MSAGGWSETVVGLEEGVVLSTECQCSLIKSVFHSTFCLPYVMFTTTLAVYHVNEIFTAWYTANVER